MADIENGDDFLRISNLVVTKLADKDSLGNNSVTIQFSTVFPNNKYAAALFKDYAAQMEKIKQQQETAEKKDSTQEDTKAETPEKSEATDL